MDVGKREDAMLDYMHVLIRNSDEAIRLCGKLILAHPELDAGLTAVIMRLANTNDSLVPVAYDSFGAPLMPHQL